MTDASNLCVPRATSRMEPPASTIIRKRPDGRALLTGSAAVAFSAKQNVTQTPGAPQRSLFHKHAACCVGTPHDTVYHAPTTLCCWHCTEGFGNPPLPMPIRFDAVENKFVVTGIFCSLSCVKAYITECAGFDCCNRLAVFSRMAQQVYGENEVVASPQRLTLAKFGGTLSTSEFRRASSSRAFDLHMSPFICNYMVIEEAAGTDSTLGTHWRQSIRGLRRPTNPQRVESRQKSQPSERPLFEKFVAERERQQGDARGVAGEEGSGAAGCSGCAEEEPTVAKEAARPRSGRRRGDSQSLMQFMETG